MIRSGKTHGESVILFDIDTDKTKQMADTFRCRVAQDETEVLTAGPNLVVLAVKPQILGRVLDRIAPHVTANHVMISIAAGISTEFILSRLPAEARVVRAMPNAAALIGESATALCLGGAATEADAEIAIDLFRAFGHAVRVDEKMMNVVTALAGSGPAYVFVVLEALVDGAVNMGLDRPTARRLAVQTMIGAARIAEAEPGVSLGTFKDRITSPGGTTIAGLQAIEQRAVRGALMEAIERATQRGAELQST
jgi:pyrroline-5-carboxylate reductase